MSDARKGGDAPLLPILRARFEAHPERHPGIAWEDVAARLEASPDGMRALAAMEESGGEPDVIGRDPDSGGFVFCDCSAQSPKGRRSLCYDREAWEARKKHKPSGNARETAAALGAEMLDEAQYLALQALGPFDTATSSWLRTPDAVRERGGAIFGDHRFGRTFVYHNGAESYYAGRGFRCRLVV
jgi:hypothetical protein